MIPITNGKVDNDKLPSVITIDDPVLVIGKNTTFTGKLNNVAGGLNFTVNGVKMHTLLNDTESTQTANINSTVAMKMYVCEKESDIIDMIEKEFSGYTPIWLGSGDNNYNLQKGENILVFVGSGLINVIHERGALL